MPLRPLIGHLDADCFYVSCERVRFPGLRNTPVGVLGNQGACVIAKSYEMKERGVRTALPIWEAQKLCPEAIYVKRDFHWYETLSRKILDLVKEVSPAVEYYSIDELFFDASSLTQVFRQPFLEAAKTLQGLVMEGIGIPVSIGIAPTKILAKLISDSAKPFGVGVVLDEISRWNLLRGKSVEDITGIAGKSRQKLEQHGIVTCEDFAKAPRALLREILTKKGEDLWWEINGIPLQPLETQRPYHKAISRGGSIGKASGDKVRAEAWLIRNTERLIEALQNYAFYCARVALYLGYKDDRSTFGEMNLWEPSAHFEELGPSFRMLFEKGWKSGQKLHYMHVFALHLQFPGTYQQSLFSRKSSFTPSRSDVMKLVNARNGRFAVRSAATLPLQDIYEDQANDYDICDIQGKLCF